MAIAGCLCLFATHFHELTSLEQDKGGKGVQNLHVMAEADPVSNKLTMLYKVSHCLVYYVGTGFLRWSVNCVYRAAPIASLRLQQRPYGNAETCNTL